MQRASVFKEHIEKIYTLSLGCQSDLRKPLDKRWPQIGPEISE